ncbi:MAG: hypothetical protein ACI9OJ_002629, partial [Myxococcota bacterium]
MVAPMSLNNLHSLLVSVLRGGRGWYARSTPDVGPVEPLQLYEFEA